MVWLAGVQEAAIAQTRSPKAGATVQPVASNTATLHVNPATGNDSTAKGSPIAPFKTLTRALDVAQPHTTIQLAPGVYSAETGESFPIALKPRVTVQGDPDTRGQDVVIRGGAVFASPNSQRNITILGGANGATLTGVTVTNPDGEGYGIQIESSSPTIADNTFIGNGQGGIILVGGSASLIRNNFFHLNRANGVSIYGTSRPVVQENVFEQTGTAILVDHNATPLITGNRMTQNNNGLIVQGEARPKLRQNSVEGNVHYGLLAIAHARPDLGSTTEPEDNFFRNNKQGDISLQTLTQTPLSNQPGATGTAKTPPPTPPKPSISPEATSPQAPPTQATSPQATVTSTSPNSSPTQRQDASAIVSPQIVKLEPVSIAPSSPTPPKLTPDIPAPPTPATAPLASPPLRDRPPLQPPKPAIVSPEPTTLAKPPSPELPPVSRGDGITAAGFPVPTASTKPENSKPALRPIQVVRMDVAAPESPLISEKPIAVVTVGRSGGRSETDPAAQAPARVPVPTAPSSSNPSISRRSLPAVPPPQSPSPAPQLNQPATLDRAVRSQEQSAALFPTPGLIQPAAPVGTAQPVQPDSRRSHRFRPTLTPAPASPISTNSIVIPVPPPETGQIPRTVAPVVALPGAASQPPAKTPLLPVPGPNIPVGNIGDMPKVYSARGNAQQTAFSASPGLPTVGSVVVRYRVVVVANTDTQQEQLRTIAPDAFPVTYRGQKAVQVGAFGDRTKADQLAAALTNQGLTAQIETLE